MITNGGELAELRAEPPTWSSWVPASAGMIHEFLPIVALQPIESGPWKLGVDEGSRETQLVPETVGRSMRLGLLPTIALLWAALASDGLAQAPSAPGLDDLVERFAAIVERDAPDEIESPPFEGLSEELRRLNPGREQAVAEYVSRTAQCSAREFAAARPRTVRSAARALGEESLSRLVAFLEGPGGEELRRSREGERVMPMSEAATEGWERVEDDYKRWMYSIPAHMSPESFARAERCYEAEAARLGLRVE